MSVIFFMICFAASAIGAICGIGGGLGKQLLHGMFQVIGDEEVVGLIQALCLMTVTIGMILTNLFNACKFGGLF